MKDTIIQNEKVSLDIGKKARYINKIVPCFFNLLFKIISRIK